MKLTLEKAREILEEALKYYSIKDNNYKENAINV